MTDQRLRNQIGVFIILANLLVVGVTLTLYFAGGFLYDEMTTTVALLIPMFSVYTTAIIKNIISNRTQIDDQSSKISGQYFFISWLFPTIFVLYLVSLVVLKAFNVGFASFEQFKAMLIASEAIFGAYVGLILSSMFHIPKNKTNTNTLSKTRRG